MNEFNKLFIQDFATPVGIIAGAMVYKVDIEPEDANGEDNVFAQIIVKPNNINIFIKQLFEERGMAPFFVRRNHVVIFHDEYLGSAIQQATMEGFIEE